MRVLIGMERHGRTRDAFRERGHDAWSLDILDADPPSEFHIKEDLWQFLDRTDEVWDLGIFHPSCTYLTAAGEWAYKDGPYHQKPGPDVLLGAERRQARREAIAEVKRIAALHKVRFKRLAIENPVGVLSREFRKPDQIIQPYWFGDDASKSTCLWLYDLPPLEGTDYVRPSTLIWEQDTDTIVGRWANQSPSGAPKLGPSADRWDKRSETFPGIAAAFATQWG